MVLGWGILAPLSVLIARFFKILPSQNWPKELDSKVWWRSHWVGQTVVFGLSVVGMVLVLPLTWVASGWHGTVGYGVLVLLLLQVALGVFRGSKGGPTAPASDGSPRGHHYDMTPWRRGFEALHKALGYGLLGLAMLAILLGLWSANGPRWMWIALLIWWPVLIAAFFVMQRRGMAVDTYQAIWGADPSHPGNRLPHPNWGVRRPGDNRKGDAHVRRDRGDGLRRH
jgi:hypothetical protein